MVGIAQSELRHEKENPQEKVQSFNKVIDTDQNIVTKRKLESQK